MQDALGQCPLCGGELIVTEYSCRACGSSLRGEFQRCDLCNLPQDLLHFVRVFLKCQGNIKEVEKALGLSYPTVKARLARINQILSLENFSEYVKTQDRLDLLREFKEGGISLDDLLRQIESD